MGECLFVQREYGHVFSNGSNYVLGIFVTSTGETDPDLYEMLEGDNPIEGVPGQTPVEGASEDPMEWFGDRERAIWASITESEGSLKALNTYDTALLSVGPVQQTAGAGEAKGELQGALDTLKQNAPEAYWRHFGRFGLQPVAPSLQAGAKKAHFKLRGERLDTGEKKERLRSFKWAYLFQRAMENPTVRYWMMREGFERLNRIRDWSSTMELPDESGELQETRVRISDVFQSGLGQALLLDAHINRPGLLSSTYDGNVWTERTKSLLESRNGTAHDPTLTADEERELIAIVMQNRVNSEMTDGAGRAIGILKHTEDEEIQNLATTNQPSQDPQTVSAFLNRILDLEDNRAHSGESAWTDIQNHDAEPLSFTGA